MRLSLPPVGWRVFAERIAERLSFVAKATKLLDWVARLTKGPVAAVAVVVFPLVLTPHEEEGSVEEMLMR